MRTLQFDFSFWKNLQWPFGLDGNLYLGVPFTYTANTHTSTLINGLPNNHNIFVNATVTGSGVPGGAYVISHTANSVTISAPTSSTLTTPITFTNPSSVWSEVTTYFPGVIADFLNINIAAGYSLTMDTTPANEWYFIGCRETFTWNGSIIGKNNGNIGTTFTSPTPSTSGSLTGPNVSYNIVQKAGGMGGVGSCGQIQNTGAQYGGTIAGGSDVAVNGNGGGGGGASTGMAGGVPGQAGFNSASAAGGNGGNSANGSASYGHVGGVGAAVYSGTGGNGDHTANAGAAGSAGGGGSRGLHGQCIWIKSLVPILGTGTGDVSGIAGGGGGQGGNATAATGAPWSGIGGAGGGGAGAAGGSAGTFVIYAPNYLSWSLTLLNNGGAAGTGGAAGADVTAASWSEGTNPASASNGNPGMAGATGTNTTGP